MTNEERDLIAKFIARVGGAPQQQQGGFLGGSVPTTQPQLPPVDREADQFIAQQFQQYPEARYRITQTAMVQEAAMAEAQNRIRRLEWELEQARQAMQQQAHQQPQQSRGFLGGLFGGGSPQPRQGFGPGGFPAGFHPTSPPPQPQYPPGYNPGMFQQRGGSGFLGTALTTAAGVAGGMVVGNALMNMFSGHDHTAGLGAAASDPTGGLFGGAGATPVSDPTGGFGAETAGLTQDAGFGGGFGGDPFAQGGAEKGYDNAASYDQGGDPFAGDAGGFDGGGFGDEA